MSLDLNKLENKLDEALSNETSETLNKFLNNKRMTNNKQQTAVEWFWNQLPEILPFTVDTETAVKLQEAYQQAKEMEKAKNPIELPSDEEIEKANGYAYYGKPNGGKYIAFNDGAKWMRDKITGGNK